MSIVKSQAKKKKFSTYPKFLSELHISSDTTCRTQLSDRDEVPAAIILLSYFFTRGQIQSRRSTIFEALPNKRKDRLQQPSTQFSKIRIPRIPLLRDYVPLKKHNPDVQVIAADPYGSILALPASINDEHANEPYKVEGIGYDFIPQVLDQTSVDKWYKTGDKESFKYARRLIAEEGLLVGGSSGSAIAALVKAAQDKPFGKDDVVVVVLPDSIRSYLSKVRHTFCFLFSCFAMSIRCF